MRGSDGERCVDIPVADIALDRALDRQRLQGVLPRLNGREQLVLRRLYFDGYTQQRVADELGASQMQVSRVLAHTVAKLRRWCRDETVPATTTRYGQRDPGYLVATATRFTQIVVTTGRATRGIRMDGSDQLALEGEMAVFGRPPRRFAHVRGSMDGRRSYAVDLVVTELVANALLHGATPITVRVSRIEDGAHIAVTDSSKQLPVTCQPGAGSMTGRGLEIVTAMATRSGCRPTSAGRESRLGRRDRPDQRRRGTSFSPGGRGRPANGDRPLHRLVR